MQRCFEEIAWHQLAFLSKHECAQVGETGQADYLAPEGRGQQQRTQQQRTQQPQHCVTQQQAAILLQPQQPRRTRRGRGALSRTGLVQQQHLHQVTQRQPQQQQQQLSPQQQPQPLPHGEDVGKIAGLFDEAATSEH